MNEIVAIPQTSASRAPVPPEIAKAIVAVMKAVKRLEKGEENKHGNYNFTSIDAFLEFLRPICAAQGLAILPDEESISFQTTQTKSGPRTWLVIEFSFTLIHESGATWAHRPRRTGMADASMGSQAFGAAQSYALKQFERALFMISTGDGEDSDASAPAELPAERDGPITGEDLTDLQVLIERSGADLPKFVAYMKVDNLKQLKKSQLPRAREMLHAKLDARQREGK